MYLGEDVIFDVVGVMLDKEAQQLEDKAENLNVSGHRLGTIKR